MICRVKRHMMAFAYQFINSTVHTSKVIWALKTIKKLMNAFYWWEATRLHGTTAPSSGRKLKYPNTGTKGNGGWYTSGISEAEHWSGTWFIFQVSKTNKKGTFHSSVLIDEAWCGWQGREDRLIQAILHNIAFWDQYLQTLFKNKAWL